jgi:hypothetical protein
MVRSFSSCSFPFSTSSNFVVEGCSLTRDVTWPTADPQRFFKFIFLKRSWATDRANLTKSLRNLGEHAKGTDIPPPLGITSSESVSLLDKSDKSSAGNSKKQVAGKNQRSPLWLFIFPEGTITSDEERVKSKRYADKEGIVSLHFSIVRIYTVRVHAFIHV